MLEALKDSLGNNCWLILFCFTVLVIIVISVITDIISKKGRRPAGVDIIAIAVMIIIILSSVAGPAITRNILSSTFEV